MALPAQFGVPDCCEDFSTTAVTNVAKLVLRPSEQNRKCYYARIFLKFI